MDGSILGPIVALKIAVLSEEHPASWPGTLEFPKITEYGKST
jgi:hypothetical protein